MSKRKTHFIVMFILNNKQQLKVCIIIFVYSIERINLVDHNHISSVELVHNAYHTQIILCKINNKTLFLY